MVALSACPMKGLQGEPDPDGTPALPLSEPDPFIELGPLPQPPPGCCPTGRDADWLHTGRQLEAARCPTPLGLTGVACVDPIGKHWPPTPKPHPFRWKEGPTPPSAGMVIRRKAPLSSPCASLIHGKLVPLAWQLRAASPRPQPCPPNPVSPHALREESSGASVRFRPHR